MSKTLCIENRAFYNCSALKKIDFSANLKKLKICPEAFSSSNKDLANKIKEINLSVCINLNELDIENRAFYNCLVFGKC